MFCKKMFWKIGGAEGRGAWLFFIKQQLKDSPEWLNRLKYIKQCTAYKSPTINSTQLMANMLHWARDKEEKIEGQ